jgi:mono/diheme cytochrome c family protein
VKRVVDVVQVLAVLAAAAFVVLLFANEPDRTGSATPTADGAAIFSTYCAGCHGATGGGGVGPQLSEGKVAGALTREAQVNVVTHGVGAMPAWGDRLSDAEIEAVVDYTRSL